MAERIWSTSSSSYVTEKHKERHAIKRYKARESAGHLAFMSSNRTSFGVYLRTKSARLTPQNIVNVPMETICANIPISNTKVKTPVRAQVKMLAFTGVPYVSETFAMHFGINPSLAIAMYTLGCPTKHPNREVTIQNIAPQLTTTDAHGMPFFVNATEKGASTSICSYDTMPVITPAIAQYKIPLIAKEPRIPIGKSLPGFFVSSAKVATVSNPMNAKKTTDAADMTPCHPNSGGMKGV